MDSLGVSSIMLTKSKSPKSISIARLRRAMEFVINSSPDILSLSDFSSEGEISFSISLKDFGIPYDDFKELKAEIFSHFFVDCVGELFVRENIELFTQQLTEMNYKSYDTVVNYFEHKHFGMKIEKEIVTFTFHANLLQVILIEDFKNQIQE